MLAGVPTGAVMAVAEVDGNTSALILPPIRAISLDRFPRAAVRARSMDPARSFLRAGVRAHPIDSARSFPGLAVRALSIDTARSFPGLAVRARSIDTARSFLHTAPVGYLRSAPEDYAASRHRFVRVSTFLRSASIGYSTVRAASNHCHVRASGTENTPAETDPKTSPSYWDRIVGILSSNIFKLFVLGVSIGIGCMAVKGHPIALTAVEVCDKTHKVFNILSKALPIVIALFKGGEGTQPSMLSLLSAV